jgi:hypothetical protein
MNMHAAVRYPSVHVRCYICSAMPWLMVSPKVGLRCTRDKKRNKAHRDNA